MCFGIGSTLSKAFSVREMIILPSPSALSLTCARMGWQYKDVELITLHGRPLASIEAYLQPLAKLVVLSNDEHSPKEVAHLLQKRVLEIVGLQFGNIWTAPLNGVWRE